MTIERYKKVFLRQLKEGGRCVMNQFTGEEDPQRIYRRRYFFYVREVGDDYVVFDIESEDTTKHSIRGFSPKTHGRAKCPLMDSPQDMFLLCTRSVDKDFYEQYTPITSQEAWDKRLQQSLNPL